MDSHPEPSAQPSQYQALTIDADLARAWMWEVIGFIDGEIRKEKPIAVEQFCRRLATVINDAAGNAVHDELGMLFDFQEAICYGLQGGVMFNLIFMDPQEASYQFDQRQQQKAVAN